MSWKDDAACKGMPSQVFYPQSGDSETEALAKSVCASCTVKIDCEAAAIINMERFGVWGGKSSLDRRRLRIARFPPSADPALLDQLAPCKTPAARVRHKRAGVLCWVCWPKTDGRPYKRGRYQPPSDNSPNTDDAA